MLCQNQPPKGLLQTFAEEPALLELAVVLFVFGVFWLVMWWASRIAEGARSRAALEDYLLGAEQALSGDLKGAQKRLQRVLKEAPDNQPARLLYGEVLLELGDAAQAHKHHLELHRSFKLDSPRNDMARARSLLAAGHPEEAVEPAAAAARRLPDSVAAWRYLYQAQMALGTPLEAGRSGARLSRMLPAGDERDQVRRASAAALARAGEVRLLSNDLGQARALVAEARALDQDGTRVRLLAARVGLAADGPEAARQLLATAPQRLLPPPTSEPGLLPLAPGGGASLPAAVVPLVALVPGHAWRCRRCFAGLQTAVAVCVHCGVEQPAELVEGQVHREVESPSILMDEVEENQAHVRRLLEALEQGGEAARNAHDSLLELGEDAIEDILETGVRRSSAQPFVVEVLRQMGARILPALFRAYQNLKERRVLGIPGLRLFRSPADVVRRVVQGYGAEAKAWFEQLLNTEDRDLRKVLLDYYLSLGDQEEFKKVLDRFPPVEVIHRMNDADPELMQPLLRSVERGSFLAEGLLVHSTFHRDLDLLDALRDADDPSILEQIISRRGANRQITAGLIQALKDENDKLRAAAGRLLDGFGLAAMGEVIAEFADLDEPVELRADLSERIVRIGGARVVERICDCLGSSPSRLDGEVVKLLSRVGRPAIAPLAEAYQQGGLLEKLAGSLVRRYSHRRTVILQAIREIGGGESIQELTRMLDRETDSDLQLKIKQTLHELSQRVDDATEAADTDCKTATEQAEQTDQSEQSEQGEPQEPDGGDHGQVG